MNKHAILSLGDVQARIELQQNVSGLKNDSPHSGIVIMMNEQMGPLMEIARYIVDQVKLVSPDEMQLNFGISANGEGGFLCFAKAGVEAQFNVTMTWKKPTSTKDSHDVDE